MSRRSFLASAALAAATFAAAGCRTDEPAVRKSSPSSASTPRWPAEWEPHSRTLMSMPFRPAIYDFGRTRLPQIQREWAAVAHAIARFEPVTMIVPPGQRTRISRLLGDGVDTFEAAYDDGWLRDNGPIFLTRPITGLDWVFNGWGGAFGQPYTSDDELPKPLLHDLGIPRLEVPMVLEGGSVQNDGEGTIITTEECLLNPNRNPSLSKAQIEAMLLKHFNAEKVIWLPFGLLSDLTSGHVDGVCIFIAPGKVIAQVDPNNAKEDSRLQRNIAILEASTDARGRSLEIVKFPILPRARFASGPEISHCYINFYPVADGLIVPLSGIEEPDREAMKRLRGLFPGREVVGVPTPTATWAGGGVHCITQQLPASDLPD